MSAIRESSGAVKIRAKHAFLLIGLISLSLFTTGFTTGCAGLVSANKSAPASNGDTTGPTVTITAPTAGKTESGSVTVSATVTDSVGVTSVQFLLDGANVGGLLTASPYNYLWDTTKSTSGTHTLKATAKDVNGNVGTSASVSVTVQNSTDTTPPTVSITSPANGAAVTGTITVSANASDNVAVASVQFRVDGANVGTADTSAPYSYALNTATLTNGSHSLTAVAKDTAGNTATSTAVAITVKNAADTTPPTVSITSPANGATVGGTITILASASDNVGVASVQILVDGAPLGAKDTTSPYSAQWNTASVSNGSHTIAAQAWDLAGNTATSSNVVVTVSQTPPPPPPPPAGDQITITDTSGLGQTNRPVTIARPFVQGEIANFAQASINGTALLTQCDVKNRWPDGSLKLAIVSFVVPSIASGGSVVISFSNQTTGNNTGFLAASDMLGAGYNFDGQIQVKGTASHNISARAILNAAAACNDPGNDPDAGAFICTYWLKGPVVTAVILEDRRGRSFDVNTDGAAGNPLHPIFEAWFYPLTNQVQLGYTLEDAWASTTANNSARDQSYSVVLTGGNTNPATEFTNPTFKQITRTRWHKTFCVNGAGAGTANNCWGAALHIDRSWPYLAETKLLPHWDPQLQITPAKIASEYTELFGNTSALNLGGCASCIGGDAGIGDFDSNLNAGGQAEWHGPMTTWDILYLMSQCDTGNSTSSTCGNGSGGDLYSVMLENADLGGMIPYWFREADSSAGHGQFFDAPNNSVPTQGRVVSINARTQIDLWDVTSTFNSYPSSPACLLDYAADWISYGGSGQDLGMWVNAAQGIVTDTSHWPNLAYASYLTTGQYAYYEEQVLQAGNAIGNSPGFTACAGPITHSTSRQGSLGYLTYGDGPRTGAWALREMMRGATVAVDDSPEQTYFLDKVRTNIAVWEGSHNIPCDVPGTGIQEPYCGTANTTAWGWGNTVRDGVPYAGNALGAFTDGLCPTELVGCYSGFAPLCQAGPGCTPPADANANFMADYTGFVIGEMNDLGYCPTTSGTCPFLSFIKNWYINVVMDPNASMYLMGDYVYPVLDGNGNSISSWSENQSFFAVGAWPRPGWGGASSLCGDEGYGAEGVSILGYVYNMTSNEGYSGATAYNTARASLLASCTSSNILFNGTNGSPKWDITPRITSNPSSPTVAITAPTSGSTVSGSIAVAATASAGTGNTIASVQFQVDGSNMGSAVTSVPYAQSLNTMALTAGQHSLTAVATDSANHQSTSAAVAVTVNNGGGSTTPPTVPTGLTATAVSSTVVNLSWTASTDTAGVTGYNVFRNGTQVGTAPSTTYQDSGLLASTSYSYTVSAFDGVGNTSAQSASASVTTPPGSSGGNPLSTAAGWHKISFSELKGSENTSPCPANNYGGYGYAFFDNCPSLMLAWSGGMADTARHRLIVWGGGHTDYFGNELYAVDLTKVGTCTATSPCMYRLDNPSNPTSCIASNTCDANPDGTPIARHTYDGLVYMPTSDQMISIGGGYYGGNGNQNVWTLNMGSVTSACAPNCTPAWTHLGTVAANSSPGEGYTAWWNSVSSTPQFIDDQNNLETFTMPTGPWTVNTTGLSVAGYNSTVVYDSNDQIAFDMGCGTVCSAFWVSTAAGSNFAQHNITIGGSCGPIQTGYPIMAWDPVARVIRVLVNGSNTQYLLTPNTASTTWNCATETYGSTSGADYPPAMNTSMQGIFGRWNYFADWDVYILCNDPTQDCWYFRPNR
jgi:hypothetical protein